MCPTPDEHGGLSSVLIFRRGLAGMHLEVLSEGELFGKTQFVGHLLDQDIRLAQEVFRLIDSHHVDPFHRRETGFPLDDVCKMARRECLLFRIILHCTVLLVLLVERKQEGHQHLPFELDRLVRFLKLGAEKQSMLQKCFLLEQSDDGVQQFALHGMIGVG